jgi:hypothetical protein
VQSNPCGPPARQRLAPTAGEISERCAISATGIGSRGPVDSAGRPGSWLVRISLAQVGKWIVDLGEVPAAALKDVPAEFTAGELDRWSTVSETPSGRLRHLKPAVQLSETPPYWARPSVPLGYHRPVWP